MFASQYKGKRVFITGHTGFKGSWLCAWLLKLGAEVCGYAIDIPSQPSAFKVLDLEKRMKDVRADVRDLDSLKKTMQDFKPDIIFHLAAQALVRPSYDDPISSFQTNAMGTMNVLEAARSLKKLRGIVCITSDKCYRNDEWIWGYRESDHLGGKDPYSASKACAEIIAHSYFNSFFKEDPCAATVRAGNVIGGGDWAVDRIVPDCARAFAQGESVFLRSPEATRPWQHVLEPLSGYLWLGAKMLAGEKKGIDKEAFNFGPSADLNATVEEVVQELVNHWPGFFYGKAEKIEEKAKESTLLKLCCDKALAHLNWHAVMTFKESMDFTAAWYLKFYKNQDTEETSEGKNKIFDFTLSQIDEYQEKADSLGLLWTKS